MPLVQTTQHTSATGRPIQDGNPGATYAFAARNLKSATMQTLLILVPQRLKLFLAFVLGHLLQALLLDGTHGDSIRLVGNGCNAELKKDSKM